jgi:biopolymer transport protein ExbD
MKVTIEEDDVDTEIQMGPLIDCVFLLLIFFLVVAVTKKSIKDLNIRLPESAQAVESKPRDDNIVIRVTRDGVVYLGSDEMTRQTLKRAIRDAGARKPDNKVVLDADISAPMMHLAPIIDELQFSGLTNLCIHVSAQGKKADI